MTWNFKIFLSWKIFVPRPGMKCAPSNKRLEFGDDSDYDTDAFFKRIFLQLLDKGDYTYLILPITREADVEFF